MGSGAVIYERPDMDTYYVTPENAYILIVLVLVNGTL
jgi:hypothetical protein